MMEAPRPDAPAVPASATAAGAPDLIPASTPGELAGGFRIPERRIITPDDLAHFHASPMYTDLVAFIETCSDAVRNRKVSDDVLVRPVITDLVRVLNDIDALVDATPAEAEPKSRFGNPAFRLFYDRVQQQLPSILEDVVRPSEAVPEVARYLEKSFGDRKRIDYGTGHEANFMAFLLALHKLGLVTDDDKPALILRVFVRYIDLMRKVQFTYWLEPAGSHGVWGLDDYHSLPFLFGASQLADHKHLRPKSIHNAEIVEAFAADYMYLGCIQFINSVKTASLRWHSPMLDDISGVKSWAKVESGMRKMYRAEVLGKLPIMQHFLFGSILAFDNVSGRVVRDEDLEADDGHLHVYAMGQQFPVCCGMRLPSAIAAREREGKPRAGLPFD
ncbi:Serine/threonine-protein phosphatase 2A activator 2 [Blastocladiella emersonii ATCC 22665]|nr:Serine/threonine-protein phosphatase 2A activator 2 [Blastocladiella emersonii ATCC 22665]